MIKVRVYWERDEEETAAQRVTSTIDSILKGKQTHLGIKELEHVKKEALSSSNIVCKGYTGINVNMKR
jgi:hypothetical protein